MHGFLCMGSGADNFSNVSESKIPIRPISFPGSVWIVSVVLVERTTFLHVNFVIVLGKSHTLV